MWSLTSVFASRVCLLETYFGYSVFLLAFRRSDGPKTLLVAAAVVTAFEAVDLTVKGSSVH